MTTQSLRLAASALALSLAAFAVAPAAQARPFTAKDMATLERVGDPRVSPDGRYVVYSVRTVDYAANKASSSLWIADLKARMAPRRLAISGASSARWSANGALYYIAGKAGTDQVFKTDATGETSVQVTSAPFDVGAFKVSSDGKTIVISQTVFPDCETLACTQQRLDAKKATKASGQVHDKLFVRHWDTWADGTQNHLYALKLNATGVAVGEPVALMNGFDGDTPTKPFGGDDDFTFTPDGKSVAFSAKLAGRDESWITNYDIWTAPLDGSAKPENLTAGNKAWDAAPVYSPDGKWAAYRAMKRPGFEADRYGIILRDLASGKEHELTPAWDRSAGDIKWSRDGKAIYAVADDVGQTRIFAIDVATAKVSPVTGPGHVSAFEVGPNGLVYAQDSLKGPAQLYALGPKGGEPIKLTSVGAETTQAVSWGEPEQFSFKGWNDETVHAFVVKPANFDPAKKYPVAFLIHGGPQGSFGNSWSYRWNPQVYASAGYAVVMVDFHGSTGYGQAFTDAISQHWGDRPLEDLQKGWSAALGKYGFLDGDRACALGASYGGYMINWIAGVWNQPWKCLVDHDGVFDARGMGYSTEELWFDEWEHGGTFFDRPKDYEKFNPVNHVKDWSKPMLVIHGGKDFRIPEAQGLGSFTALQRQGIESKFLYFPDENHWVLKPQNSVQWHDEVLGWLDKWTAAPAK